VETDFKNIVTCRTRNRTEPITNINSQNIVENTATVKCLFFALDSTLLKNYYPLYKVNQSYEIYCV